MDKQYLNDEFNRFFEFPTEDKSQVSSVSAKLFAEHIAYPLERELEQLRQRVQELEELLKESYKDADEVLRPRVAELEKERDELLAAMIHIQQVACSGSPELGIATSAIASVKEKQNAAD